MPEDFAAYCLQERQGITLPNNEIGVFIFAIVVWNHYWTCGPFLRAPRSRFEKRCHSRCSSDLIAGANFKWCVTRMRAKYAIFFTGTYKSLEACLLFAATELADTEVITQTSVSFAALILWPQLIHFALQPHRQNVGLKHDEVLVSSAVVNNIR